MALLDLRINVSRSSNSNLSNVSTVMQALNQAKQFEVALKSMDYLLNDEAEIGLKLLSDGIDEVKKTHGKLYHTFGEDMILSLATGVIHFLEATLGFEPKKIAKAQAAMNKTEQLAIKAEKFNIEHNIIASEKYEIGMECKIAYIESCLLSALLMLFTESYMDTIKALYKLKKAYSGLISLNKTVQKLKDKPYKLKKRASSKSENNDALNLSRETSKDSFETCFENESECNEYKEHIRANEDTLTAASKTSKSEETSKILLGNYLPSDIPAGVFENLESKQQLSSLSEKEHELISMMKDVYQMRDSRLRGSHLGNKHPVLRKKLGDPQNAAAASSSSAFVYLNGEGHEKPTIDEFIESGVSLCYGIIQLILSILPPAVTTVLNAIGFKIDKLEGLQLLWDVVNERNIFSGLSLGSLVIYYHGPFKFIDNNFDIPIEDKKIRHLIHPGKLLDNQILKATCVFPESSLWVLQEGIILSSEGQLKKALDVIGRKPINSIQMLQIKAQIVFCRALLYCFSFEFEKAAADFLYLLEINEWSHAFYTYFAGCCYLEAYRLCDILSKDPTAAAIQHLVSSIDTSKKQYFKKRAEECLEKAPTYLNKKKFMSNNLPFDNFMLRKLKQFNEIEKKLKSSNVDLIDSVATSPIMELIYLYDGFNRMDNVQLNFALNYALQYDNKATQLKVPSQISIKNFLNATILKNLKEFEQANSLIQKELLPLIIDKNSGKFIKLKHNPWLYPSVFYELALINWNLKKMSGLKETIQYLRHSLGYMNDYELSSRIGMRSQAALNRCENK